MNIPTVNPYVRAVTFFLSYQFSRGQHRGHYPNADMMCKALLCHQMVESLAACRRLCADERDWIGAQHFGSSRDSVWSQRLSRPVVYTRQIIGMVVLAA